jgi:uncharacterized protein YndB with AHSA1/START domain
VGGKYSACTEAKDGSFDFEAIYDEVSQPNKLAYTLLYGRKVVTELKEHGDTTTITTTFDAESENSIDMQRNGWQAILDNFKKYVEAN